MSEPSRTLAAIASMAQITSSDRRVASSFSAREWSAALAASAAAACTASSAPRMSSVFAHSTAEPSSTVRRPRSVALSTSLAMFDRLARRAARSARPRFSSSVSARSRSATAPMVFAMTARRRAISLRGVPPLDPAASGRARAAVACRMGSASERPTSKARPMERAATAMLNTGQCDAAELDGPNDSRTSSASAGNSATTSSRSGTVRRCMTSPPGPSAVAEQPCA